VQPAARAPRGRAVAAPASDGRHRLRDPRALALPRARLGRRDGSFVYEPPGEIHTLVVPDDCAEMITFFNIQGAMIYVDEHGATVGYEDVWTKIAMCRAHYAKVGLGKRTSTVRQVVVGRASADALHRIRIIEP
jgi:hypothetical protein